MIINIHFIRIYCQTERKCSFNTFYYIGKHKVLLLITHCAGNLFTIMLLVQHVQLFFIWASKNFFRSITNLLVVINLGNKGIKLLFAFSRMYEILLRFAFSLHQRKRLILLSSHFQWIFQVGCFRLDIYCNDLMLLI